MFALRVSRLVRACIFQRCFISCSRWLSLVLRFSSVLKFISLANSFRSFSRFFSLDSTRNLDLSAVSFAVFWRVILKFCQRVCGFVSSLVVSFLARLSNFFWSFIPWFIILSIRGFSFRDGKYQVHLPFPMRGASLGANLTEISLWSDGIAEVSSRHSNTVWVCFLAVYILSNLDSVVFSFRVDLQVNKVSLG